MTHGYYIPWTETFGGDLESANLAAAIWAHFGFEPGSKYDGVSVVDGRAMMILRDRFVDGAVFLIVGVQ